MRSGEVLTSMDTAFDPEIRSWLQTERERLSDGGRFLALRNWLRALDRSTYAAFTHDEQVDFSVCWFQLTPAERLLLHVMSACPAFAGPMQAGGRVVFYRRGRRVGLHTDGLPMPADAEPLFALAIGEALCQRLAGLSRLVECWADAADSGARAHVSGLHHKGELAATVATLHETLLHMPPVACYVGDRLFTSLIYWGEDLVDTKKRPGRLTELIALPLDAWEADEIRFVHAALVLMQSGAYYRLEEVNSTQVDPLSVILFLQAKLIAYGESGAAAQRLPADVFALAALAKAKETSLAGAGQLYRRINGVAVNKQVGCAQLPTEVEDMPRSLEDTLLALQPNLGPARETALWLQRLAELALESGSIEDVIVAIVRSGLALTGSDFFMTRAPIGLHVPENYASLRKTDFFCLVECRPGYESARFGLSNTAERARWNQSLRMQFNSWKFWYGNLERAEMPPKQYWFFPARMPDIAFFEHTLHSGHRDNGVVHSLRSPAALRLRVEGSGDRRIMHAAFDARAVRSDPHKPYGVADLVMLIRHRFWLGVIYQTLADRRGAPVRIERFGQDYHLADERFDQPPRSPV
jgi:hypothetical protein